MLLYHSRFLTRLNEKGAQSLIDEFYKKVKSLKVIPSMLISMHRKKQDAFSLKEFLLILANYTKMLAYEGKFL